MTKRLTAIVSLLYMTVLLVVYPLYVNGGYIHIGVVKARFFQWSGLLMLLLLLPLLMLTHDRRFTRTDIMVGGILFVNILSFLMSEYKSTGLLGTTGWYMGLVTWLIMTGIYLVAEAVCLLDEKNMTFLFVLSMGGSAVVYLLGILNRFSVYPIKMAGANPDFISTLGSINWYCGYWSVFTPVGIGLYVLCKNKWKRLLLGIYCYLAFLTGITQGSSSAALVFGIVLVLLLWILFQGKEILLRLAELGMLFSVSLMSVRWLFVRWPSGMQYDSSWIRALMARNMGIIPFLVFLILWIAVYALLPEYEGVEGVKFARAYCFALLAALGMAVFVTFVINSLVPGGIWPVKNIDLFFFSDFWGNGRGGIWKDSWMAIKQMNIRQLLFGVGPDCFVDYIYEFPEITQRIVSQFGQSRLTNAHNELLTMMINTGGLGLAFYIGTFGFAIWSVRDTYGKNPFILACVLGVTGYLANNLVSFPQVLSTPFVFLLLGISQGLTKQNETHNIISIRKCNEED